MTEGEDFRDREGATGLPILDLYLTALPRGLLSYPGCRAKCSLLRAVVETNSRPVDYEGVPDSLRTLMLTPPPPNAWISEVHYVAAHAVLLDCSSHDTESLHVLSYRANRNLTESRMYSALTKVASPSLLLKSAGFTWGIIHRGTSLQIHTDKRSATVHLRHPPNLYDSRAHESACRGFRAVLEAAGAKQLEWEVTASEAELLGVDFRWG